MDTPQRWILRNIARRPVELHEAEEVRVIPPDESIEVDEIGPYAAALVSRGLVTQHEAPPADGGGKAAKSAAAAPARRSAGKRSGKAAESAAAAPARPSAGKRGGKKGKSPPPGARKGQGTKKTDLRKGEGK